MIVFEFARAGSKVLALLLLSNLALESSVWIWLNR